MSVVSLFNDRPKKPAAGSCPTTDRNENKKKQKIKQVAEGEKNSTEWNENYLFLTMNFLLRGQTVHNESSELGKISAAQTSTDCVFDPAVYLQRHMSSKLIFSIHCRLFIYRPRSPTTFHMATLRFYFAPTSKRENFIFLYRMDKIAVTFLLNCKNKTVSFGGS